MGGRAGRDVEVDWDDPDTPAPGWMGFLLALWLLLGAACIWFAVDDLRLAAGAAGTPGVLQVTGCTDLGEGRHDCHGLFRPDAGGVPVVVGASPDSAAGDVVAARLTPAGDRAVASGTTGVLAASTLPFLGVALLGYLPWTTAVVLGARRGRRTLAVLGHVLTAVFGTATLVGLVLS
ncbi:hypothetical protein [Pseudonocardia spirodelae]|uniref:Uncharacterized protein n=1 Tax=Pseudonocardia spirodelae TaxID=3133431 RepID=A0ABU8T222_9PSEU